MLLFAYVLSDPNAVLELSDFTISAAHQRLTFTVLDFLIVSMWVAIALVWLSRLIQIAAWKLLRLLSIAAGTVLLVGGTDPHPHLANSLEWTQSQLRAAPQAVQGFWDSLTSPYTKTSSPTENTERTTPLQASGEQAGESRNDKPPANTGERPTSSKPPPAKPPPPRQPAPTPEGADGPAHLIAFLVLTCIALVAWGREREQAVLVGVICLSLSIQTLQTLVTTREADAMDLALDFTGIALGALLVGSLRHWRRPLTFTASRGN